MIGKRRAVAIAGMLALSPFAIADAHIMPAHAGTINIVGHQAFIALSLPAMYFADADDNHDGMLSAAEVGAHLDLLQRLVATTIHVSDGKAKAILQYARVSIEQTSDTATRFTPSEHALVLIVALFPDEPHTVELQLDRLDQMGDAGRLFIRATKRGVTEAATLRAGHSSHTFYEPGWGRAVDGVKLGIGHILNGPDHMLFLLTLVLAGIGWRYWVGVISSFTLGHALVLIVTALGFAAPIRPALTEVLIAATIVFMATRALRNKSAQAGVMGREAALAGVCGIVHGLGVASAVQALDVNGRPDLVTLGAFNIGVEIGQLAVALLCVALLRALAARWSTSRASLMVPRLLAGGAGAAGLVWLVARLPAAF